MQYHPAQPTVTDRFTASPAGRLTARVIDPGAASERPPLVVLHGISRNASELVRLFLPEAIGTGRKIVVPHFTDKDWPVFQRPCRTARPDQALLALLAQLAVEDRAFAGRVGVFGHSGGAQLAHRFAMLYPHRVAQVHLAAAGWYCLPDAGIAHPYGTGAAETADSALWARRHRQTLPAYLRLAVRVYVGTHDTGRDDSLRKHPVLDRLQGMTRIARARAYVDSFERAARMHGIAPDVSLTYLPGVGHDVVQAIGQAGLARLVAGPEAPCLSLAC